MVDSPSGPSDSLTEIKSIIKLLMGLCHMGMDKLWVVYWGTGLQRGWICKLTL